jgi:hypothetical protein
LKQSFEMDGDLRRDARKDPDLHSLHGKLEIDLIFDAQTHIQPPRRRHGMV